MSIARGSIAARYSTAVYSADRTRILVMISVSPPEPYDHGKFILPSGIEAEVGQTFSSSGCYDASTLKPLWTVPWHACEWEMIHSENFDHVVRFRCEAMRSGNALEFYNRGTLVKSYTCNDLLQHFNSHHFLCFTSSNWHWMWYGDGPTLVGNNITLSTFPRQSRIFGEWFRFGYHEEYVFDFETGEMRSRRYVGVARSALYFATPPSVLIAAVVALRYSYRWLRKRQRARGGRCVTCGYDLRASRERCSECGTVFHGVAEGATATA